MEVRWGIFWCSFYLTSGLYEGVSCYRMPGEVWSMGIAYDTIDSLGEMKLVDTEEEERIQEGKGVSKQ